MGQAMQLEDRNGALMNNPRYLLFDFENASLAAS
jgi:hypothetical protein